MKKYHLITYGCTANQADSELMKTFLEKEGHKKTSLKESDYVLVNTCGVKQATEERIISRLKKLSKTGKKIVIGGCLPKANLDRIKKDIPSYSAILDTRSINKLPEIFQKVESGDKPIEFSDEVFSKPSFAKSFGLTGTMQISEGCDLSCTYCSTTISRGDLSCFSVEEIVRGVSTLVKSGSKEILLTSQDNGAYVDHDKRLPDLLSEICKINADFYLRNGMSNPVYLHKFLGKLIDSYKSPKIYKFLHIPVQSGSDAVLKEMKRGYKVEKFAEIIKTFRKEIPGTTISTDIIVGFPSETQEDFSQTLDLLKEIKPDNVNLSKFGKRPGTKAAEMKDIDGKVLRSRSAKCSQLAAKIALENNKKWVGWDGKVFINEASQKNGLIQISGENQPFSLEKKSVEIPKETIIQINQENVFIGRNFAYKTILIKSEKNLFGLEADVRIIDAKQTHLVGEIC